MLVKRFSVGPLGANCYVVICEETGKALVIDPGGDAGKILAYLDEQRLQAKYIINTHGHIDHIGAGQELQEGACASGLFIHRMRSCWKTRT
ncbi:Hydroxyacylglutathione hydrolase [Thermincola ferriacetica]|uniref:Hydroxyacylglutathione hydrolase n=1 Tax=Thermincola ferriacetica TaxID=281456 RepID=A0A0L6W169_9FIRM|nr:MBL fold metallo-hydrolase [Thermincola ferriacetica]KNZ69128.1 Hydroxyacylglutathione hydrolase [Thermincola ferriacetica]